MLRSIWPTASPRSASACKGNAQRVVGLRLRCRRLAGALGIVAGIVPVRRLGERPLGPGDGAGVVARSKREPSDLLEQLRALDRIAVAIEQLQARAKQAPARSRSPPSQCRPPILRCRRAAPAWSACQLELVTQRHRSARDASARRPVSASRSREPLAHRPHLVLAALALGERAERALIVADRVVVGVDRARPVAGGHQIARALGLVGRKAPVVAERFQIAQSLRAGAAGALERAAGPLVQLGPAGEQKILVRHLVHERVREPVAIGVVAMLAGSDRTRRGGQPLPRCLQRPSQWRARAPHRTPPPARPLPAAGGGRRREAGRCGRGAALQRRRNVCRFADRRARPAPALADEHAVAHQAADDLLDEQRIAAGARRDRSAGLARRRCPSTGPNSPPTSARVSSGESGASRMMACAARAIEGRRASERCESSIIKRWSASWSTTYRSSSTEAASAQWRSSTTISSGALLQAPLDQRARGQRDLTLELLGFEVARPRLLDPEHVAQHRRDGLRRLGRGSERPQSRRQLLPGDVERVRPAPPGRLRGTAPRRYRRWARPAMSRRPGGRRCRRAGHRLRGEPGTRRSAATCPHPPRRPGSRPGPGRAASARTPRAAGRARRRARPAALRARGPRARARIEARRARRAGDGRRSAPTCRAALSSRGGLEREAMPGESVGGVGDQDGSRGRRQEPGRRIHRVARHRVGGSRSIAEAAGHDRAGVDADVKRHWSGRAGAPTRR